MHWIDENYWQLKIFCRHLQKILQKPTMQLLYLWQLMTKKHLIYVLSSMVGNSAKCLSFLKQLNLIPEKTQRVIGTLPK